MLLPGNSQAQAVVRGVAIDDDGQIHFSILPGPVSKNGHLLDRTVAEPYRFHRSEDRRIGLP